MADDLCGGQNGGVSSEMRVGHQSYVVAKRHSAAASGVDAVFGHGAHHNEMSNLAISKLFSQIRLEEGIRCLFPDDRFILARKDGRMDRPWRSFGFDGMPLGAVMLDEHDLGSGSSCSIQEQSDIRQNAAPQIGRHEADKTDLHIHNYKRGFQTPSFTTPSIVRRSSSLKRPEDSVIRIMLDSP